jgi:hypothetical protein
LGVKNEQELLEWTDKIKAEGIPLRLFREPDRDNEATAVACVCDGSLFKGLRLI